MVNSITIECCLIFWWKCLLRYNITRNEEFVWPLQLRDIKKKSLDGHLNVLNHAFINFIFAKLELLYMIMHWTSDYALGYTVIITTNNLGAWSCSLLSRLTSTKSVEETFTFFVSFILSSFFLLFAAPLGHFLFNCGIFIKLSINQMLQSLNIIIWYEKYHLV